MRARRPLWTEECWYFSSVWVSSCKCCDERLWYIRPFFFPLVWSISHRIRWEGNMDIKCGNATEWIFYSPAIIMKEFMKQCLLILFNKIHNQYIWSFVFVLWPRIHVLEPRLLNLKDCWIESHLFWIIATVIVILHFAKRKDHHLIKKAYFQFLLRKVPFECLIYFFVPVNIAMREWDAMLVEVSTIIVGGSNSDRRQEQCMSFHEYQNGLMMNLTHSQALRIWTYKRGVTSSYPEWHVRYIPCCRNVNLVSYL